MEALCRFCSGLLSALAGLFSPVNPLVGCAMLFIAVDFLTGVAADRARTLRSHKRWYFASRRAWRTVLKAGFVALTIVLAWLLEQCVMNLESLHLARLLTGFVCGVELWSFLENAGELSDGPLFRALRRVARSHLRKEVEDE